MNEKKTTRSVFVAGRTVIITGVPEHITDDEVRTFALMKIHQIYKKVLSSKGKAS